MIKLEDKNIEGRCKDTFYADLFLFSIKISTSYSEKRELIPGKSAMKVTSWERYNAVKER